MSDARFWLALSLVPSVGAKRLEHLLAAFGTAEAAWRADYPRLRDAGIDEKTATAITAAHARIQPDTEMAKVTRLGGSLITLADEAYPPLLRSIATPPPLLYVRGTLTPDDARALAIVGTRRVSQYGREAAEYFARELAASGVTIISGLAHGIDSLAHAAALKAGGRTIAVLGSGIDIVYPPEHRDLARRICERGALVSEFPVGAKAERHHFPQRNRIISGMALGVLVVEAPEKSGSLITAETAAEQGRDVFAVPGSIFSANTAGTHALIRDGAKVATRPQDILDEFDIAYQHMQTREAVEVIQPANADEAALLPFLSDRPTHADDLTRLSGLPSAAVISALTLMELRGIVQSVGVMQYVLSPTHR
jgi:DNA processing protein